MSTAEARENAKNERAAAKLAKMKSLLDNPLLFFLTILLFTTRG